MLFSERGREKTEKVREEERSELESARERERVIGGGVIWGDAPCLLQLTDDQTSS